jgi:uncharacterized repeat protein (TIGR04076 family)
MVKMKNRSPFLDTMAEEQENKMDLIIKVKEIKGHCPVYKVGDSFKLEEGYRLVTDIPLCMHSLASLLPYYNALQVSEPDKWGLAGKEDKTRAYVQCLDPHTYSDGGTVIFEISRKNNDH